MGERLGRYLVRERIGRGGMGEVFAGELVGADGFSREVAIKRIRCDISANPAFARRFVREARIASLLHHDNIVSVLDFDRDARGQYYLVMERIRGVDLAALWATGRLPTGPAVFIATAILRALAHTHELDYRGRPLGLVHRDVSPHNVMLSWSGQVKLMDFGVAHAVRAAAGSLAGSLPGRGGVRGTASYMSPEQTHDLELDGRADLFSTGVILHELLTGQRLFAGVNATASMELVLRKSVPSPAVLQPDIPASVATVCLRLLARDRRARFENARVALSALRAASAPVEVATAGLRQLLAERFPERFPLTPRGDGRCACPKEVPLAPSLILDDPAAAVLQDAATRTVPGPGQGPTRQSLGPMRTRPGRLLLAMLPILGLPILGLLAALALW